MSKKEPKIYTFTEEERLIHGQKVMVKVYESQAASFIKGWRSRKEAGPTGGSTGGGRR